jgi:hypothetical protein
VTPASTQEEASAVRFSRLWLLSPRADLAVVGLPYGLMTLAFIASTVLGQGPFGGMNRLAIWTAQNVLGNGTHVILTFLVFAMRPDTLHATKALPRQALMGIPLMAIVATGLLTLYNWDKTAQLYATAVIFNIFGLHHVLSQSKGWWSLHHLRAREAGLTAPSARERTLQSVMVPINLSMVLCRMFFIPEGEGEGPYIDVGQGSVLPYGSLVVLVLVWLGYWAMVFRTLFQEETVRGPKVLYLFAVSSGIALTLVAPSWGNVILPGMHGIEYYLLSSRLLEQREGDVKQLPRKWIWPAMVLVMIPLMLIGLVTGLRGEVANGTLATNVVSSLSNSNFWRFASWADSTCVLAHYWADAFIYRFRIPEIRQTMLRRLGFAVAPR